MYDLLLEGKISFVQTWDGEEIKATDCIIKVAITRGNIKWRSFSLTDCTSKNKKRMTTSASLYEGPIFYFSCRVNFLFQSINSLVGKHHVVGKYPDTYIQLNIGDHDSLFVNIIPEINKLEAKH